MFGADKGKLESGDHRLSGRKLRIGMVQARFNEAITGALAKSGGGFSFNFVCV